MARPLRISYPGAIYHVSGRMLGSWGDHRDRLFRDNQDRERFLERLGQGVEDFEGRLYLFCLMGNHYHLLLETPRANVSRLMQSVTTGYTIYFNRRHQRHGHVFDGRFRSEVVSGDEYLLKLSRYIHHNPVSVRSWARRSVADRIEKLRAYRWSSYRGYIGQTKQLAFVSEEPILAMMSGGQRRRRRSYRDYVEGGVGRSDLELQEALAKRSKGIGDQAFRVSIERIRNETALSHRVGEDVSFPGTEGRLEASVILGIVGKELSVPVEEFRQRRNESHHRGIAARFLQKYGEKNQREIAELLGIGTGAAVSLQLRRLRAAEASDRKLAKRLVRMENALKALKSTVTE